MSFDTKKIDEIIVGRVIPHIYAFSTNTIPNYLKVGDTYRTVESRLKEWEHHFPHLNKEYEKEAVLKGTNYFRDYSVHKFLETKKEKQRLQPSDLPNGVYYSNEFFKDTIQKDIDEAFEDINNDFNTHGNEYDFYDLLSKQQVSTTFERNQDFNLRPNQKEVVDNFIKAINRKPKNKHKNLLMYAVMRFGKSFTSLCCAKEMNAKIVVVVSGKADVGIEWKQTAESHKFFENYLFITSKELKRDTQSISNALKRKKRVIVFLTLQDLSGKDIKDKHKDIFSNEIDLLIVDETHFAARAEEYGKVLQDVNIKEYKEDETLEEAEESYKYLSRKVTLHLSGTPYRLLMGSEFKKDDIICFCQFTDIIKEQSKWDEKWLLKDTYDSKDCEGFGKHIGDKVHEWDNPYYGFPQMVRFAFNPNEETQNRLDQLKNNGESYAFSKLFRPQSIEKDVFNKHKEFIYEREVLDLIKCIDGSKEDSNIFPFLNYEKIKEGKMCHHMVIVLPYCASCDAMEELLLKYKSEFKNLCDYEILNISGVDDVKKYKKTSDVIKAISKFEEDGKKTITLTVQRMLTGSTVKEWDTMIYLKDTSSPQEYDQAIFRLQNQYIETRVDESIGDVVKINLKPQTLLIDFAPNRMFYMQEKKAQIYNANIDESGNKKLKDRINYELKISPIIVVNKDKLVEVEEADILEAISNYNYDRGISEEAKEVSIDLSILDNDIIRNVIESENEIDSKGGLEIKANKGDGTKLDDGKDDEETDTKSDKNEGGSSSNDESGSKENETTKLIKKIQNYYRRILLFAFLTKNKITSLDEMLVVLEKGENKRISRNLGLNKSELNILRNSFKNKFVLSSLDYKIQDLNNLSFSTKTENEKLDIAISKFGKLGDAIVNTPKSICDEIIKTIGDASLKQIIDNNEYFLDIASVSGEFAISIVNKMQCLNISKEKYQHRILSIPKSPICYELTRKVYEILELDIDNIAVNFDSFNLLDFKDSDGNVLYESIANRLKHCNKLSKNSLKKEGASMLKIGAIVGNPPYQDKGGSGGNNDAPIYQHFSMIAQALNPHYISLIIKAAWFSGGRENLLADFRKRMISNRSLKSMKVFTDSSEVFENVEIKGGICVYLVDSNYTGDCNYTVITNGIEETFKRDLSVFGDLIIRDPNFADLVNKIISSGALNKGNVGDLISSDTPFGIPSNPKTSKKTPFKVYTSKKMEHDVTLYHIENNKRKIEYVSKQDIKKNVKDIDKNKVFIPGGYGAGESFPHQILGEPEIAKEHSVCSQSYLYAAFETELEAINFSKYIHTKFLRALVASIKISQSAPNRVYKYVPLENFSKNSDVPWEKNIDEIDEFLNKKYKLDKKNVEYIQKMIKPMQ